MLDVVGDRPRRGQPDRMQFERFADLEDLDDLLAVGATRKGDVELVASPYVSAVTGPGFQQPGMHQAPDRLPHGIAACAERGDELVFAWDLLTDSPLPAADSLAQLLGDLNGQGGGPCRRNQWGCHSPKCRT